MEPERDAPAAPRQGPTRSGTARSATSRRTSASSADAAPTTPKTSTPAAKTPTKAPAKTAAKAPTKAPSKSAATKSAATKPEPTPAPAAADEPVSTADDVTSAELVTTPPASKAARAPRKAAGHPATTGPALSVTGLLKRFGGVTAVDHVDMEIPAGTFYGFVGPNGAGKTTTLAMITGLLRPDAGEVRVHGVDVWQNPSVAKRSLGVLPDQLRLFDRLTGAEFLHHAGALRGLARDTIAHRVDDLSAAFGLRHSLDRFVSDYSAGMVKKIAIAAAMIHSPRLLVLDEPFESVDPVSANVVIGILKKYAQAGGTVLLSSHSMTLIERTCDAVAIIADGRMLAAGPLDEVLDGESLETRFVELAGGATAVEGMEWLQSYSD